MPVGPDLRHAGFQRFTSGRRLLHVEVRKFTAMSSDLAVSSKFKPALDSEFVPAVLWNRAYRTLARTAGGPLAMALERGEGERPHHGALPDRRGFDRHWRGCTS